MANKSFHRLLKDPKIKIAGKLAVALSLLSYLVSTLDIQVIESIILRTNLWCFLLSLIVLLSRNVIAAFRWKILLQSKNYNLPIMRLTQYYLIGVFFNLFLPTAVGGDIVRGYCLCNYAVGKNETISSIVVERVLGILALMFLSLLSIVFDINLIRNDMIRVTILIAGSGIVIYVFALYFGVDLLLKRRIPAIITTKLKPMISLMQAVKEYHRMTSTVMCGFLASALFQLFGIISAYLIAVSLGCSTRFIYFLILLPIIWLISMMPISINGIGLREGAFVFLFGSVGMSKEMALTISVLFFLQMIAQAVIGSVLFLHNERRIPNNQKMPNPF